MDSEKRKHACHMHMLVLSFCSMSLWGGQNGKRVFCPVTANSLR